MHKVLLAYALFRMLRDLVSKGSKLLVFAKLEFHLLVCKELAEHAIVEEVD